MNQELIERWRTKFETADAETVRQMLAEAPELCKCESESHITERENQAVGTALQCKHQSQKSR